MQLVRKMMDTKMKGSQGKLALLGINVGLFGCWWKCVAVNKQPKWKMGI